MALRTLIALAALSLFAQAPIPWVCPMDPDIRSTGPGRCSRCGMKLQAGIRQPADYPVVMTVQPGELIFRVKDPKLGKPVTEFEIVHEKLFHLFLISGDLETFAHEHPAPRPDGSFRLAWSPPQPGIYRVFADFYPTGGTPQMVPLTLITRGYLQPLTRAALQPDLAPKQGIALALEPEQALAGKETHLQFHVPKDGLEPYLGAMGHLLVASDDLVDVIHTHPTVVSDYVGIQFDVYFPREANYRVWAQFQRHGKVVTVSFTVPVQALR